jgi:flagellar protein FliO/FliZ
MMRRALILLAGMALSLSARADDKALEYFGQAHPAEAPVHAAEGMGALTLVGIVLLGGAGAWLLLRGRKIQLPSRVARRLVIDETKSLGSRQYLVVASYEGKKMLLGVCPGRIDLITALDGSPSPGKVQ